MLLLKPADALFLIIIRQTITESYRESESIKAIMVPTLPLLTSWPVFICSVVSAIKHLIRQQAALII